MLEKMSDFFEARLDGYDEHMMTAIESANEFYPFTAGQLPIAENSRILDLGCGTGLELQEYYRLNPSARITELMQFSRRTTVLMLRLRSLRRSLLLRRPRFSSTRARIRFRTSLSAFSAVNRRFLPRKSAVAVRFSASSAI